VKRVKSALAERLGSERVTTMPPQMVAEDFAEYAGRSAVGSDLGRRDRAGALRAAAKTGAAVPELHSPTFVPDLERTLKTAMKSRPRRS